jgi:hypothetical protein
MPSDLTAPGTSLCLFAASLLSDSFNSSNSLSTDAPVVGEHRSIRALAKERARMQAGEAASGKRSFPDLKPDDLEFVSVAAGVTPAAEATPAVRLLIEREIEGDKMCCKEKQ